MANRVNGGGIGLNLEQRHFMCVWHGEPFRDRWPLGFDVYCSRIMASLSECGEFCDGCEDAPEAVVARLAERPACCWLDSDSLLQVYMQVRVTVNRAMVGDESTPFWSVNRCNECKNLNIGGPYQIYNTKGKLALIKHVCLVCVAKKLDQRSKKLRGRY